MVWLLLTSSVVLNHSYRAIAGLSVRRVLLHVTRQHMMESHLRVRVPALIELARDRVLRELHLERRLVLDLGAEVTLSTCDVLLTNRKVSRTDSRIQVLEALLRLEIGALDHQSGSLGCRRRLLNRLVRKISQLVLHELSVVKIRPRDAFVLLLHRLKLR